MTNRLFEADPPRNGEGNRSVKPNGGGGPPVLQARIKQVKRARRLRRTMSLPEVLLWQVLRKRPDGFRFRRQFPIRQMTADFACLERRLIIEVDGEGHSFGDQPRRDLVRDAILRREGPPKKDPTFASHVSVARRLKSGRLAWSSAPEKECFE